MNIHKLELHESYIVDSNLEVIRVPGGWIYVMKHKPFNQLISVYVPYSGEFKDEKKIWGDFLSQLDFFDIKDEEV